MLLKCYSPLAPTIPQMADGSLIEPPPSAPNAIGHKPKPQKQNQKS